MSVAIGRCPSLPAVRRLEFTIEPFVEGHPGPHVVRAIEAVEALGVPVEFGPFGSTCVADDDTMPDVVATVTRAAFANGATHMSLHLEAASESGGAA